MLFWLELKKLIRSPAIIGFAALCLAVNTVLILGQPKSLDWLERRAPPEPENIFADLDAQSLADRYVGKYSLTGSQEANIRAQYENLQPVIEAKAVRGDALSPYLGAKTYYLHDLLFGLVLPVTIAEGCLLALFASLMSAGYESSRHTESLICAANTGRRVLRKKLAASLTAGIGLFFIILMSAMAVFFAQYDFSPAWGENVSSSLNYAVGDYTKPLVTWLSLTVLQNLHLCGGAAILLTICFGLMGYAAGVLFRSGYASCLATIAICGALFGIEPLFPIGSHIRSLLNLSPVGLWLNSGQWFTDGGADILYTGFECLGLAVSLVVLSASCWLVSAYYKRRDLL